MDTKIVFRRYALSLVAVLILLAAISGIYRTDVGWTLWGLFQQNPTSWNGLSIPIAQGLFVSSLPSDQLLVIGSKSTHTDSLRLEYMGEANLDAEHYCKGIDASCKVLEGQVHGRKVIQVTCRNSDQTDPTTASSFCVQGSPIRLRYLGKESNIAVFRPTIDGVLNQLALGAPASAGKKQ